LQSDSSADDTAAPRSGTNDEDYHSTIQQSLHKESTQLIEVEVRLMVEKFMQD